MELLKELRLQNKFTQTQLAEALGTSQRNITRWENGKTEPTAYYIIKLSKIFNVSTDFLLGLEDDLGQKVCDSPDYAITPEERKIINAYRNLKPSNRDLVLRMLNIN